MASYWVVGGTYRSTAFRQLAEGAEEVRIGPFETYEAAREEWARLSWRTVDSCNTRYTVELRNGNGARGGPRAIA